MKKEASVILAKCAQDKLYGIRIEKRDNDWVRTWAFKLKEETAEKEGFDKSTLPEASTLTKNIQAALTAAQRNVLSAETAVR